MSAIIGALGALAVAGAPLALPVALWESGWWLRRRARRQSVYQEAWETSQFLRRPLVVVGAPDRGLTGAYPPGDLTIDIGESDVDGHFLQADVCQPLPLPDDSVVVFVSCVLEYVEDLDAAVSEILRISGGHAFFVGVEPWTLTAYLYPNAKRTLPGELR